MSVDNKRIAGICSAPRIDISFGHDAGGDFTLPDYVPEIKRFLGVNTTVLPEGKYISGGALETSGTMIYNISYVSEEGKFSTASLSCEYNADTALPVSVENIGELFCDCDVENTVCRVTSPRGISLKSRLRTRVLSDERIFDDVTVVDESGKRAEVEALCGVEKLTFPASSFVRCHGMTTSNAVGEISAAPDETPLLCEGALWVSSCEAKDGGADVKGEIFIKCLFVSDGGVNTCKKTRIPFDVFVPVGDVDISSMARAWGRVASVGLTRAAGDTGVFTVTSEYDVEAEVMGICEMTVCADAYSTGFESETDLRDCDVLASVGFGGCRLTLNGSADLKNISETAVIADVSGSVGNMQVLCEDGRVYLVGVIKTRCIIDDGELSAHDVEIPVKHEICSVSDGKSELQSRVFVSVLECSAKLSGTEISVTCEVSSSYEINALNRKRLVTCIRLGDALDSGDVVRVYYPQSDESVWSICKKYRADRGRVVKANPELSDIASKRTPVIIC